MGLLIAFVFNKKNDENLTDDQIIMKKIDEENKKDKNYKEIETKMVENSCKNNTNSTNFSKEEIEKEYKKCVESVQNALKSGIAGQLKEPYVKTVFRPFVKNQQDSYKITATTSSSSESQCIEDEYTQCGEKEEGEEQEPESNNEYNIQFIVENTTATDYTLLLIPNYENSTYDFSSYNSSNRLLEDDIEELDEIDLTEAMENSDAIPQEFQKEMDNGLQLNIIKCQILRAGFVQKCF